jgi:adenosylhomocysteine nucleosidase
MRVLVTFAVDAEFAPWRKLRHFEKRMQASLNFYSTRIVGAEVNVFLTGIGGKKSWLEATKVLWDAGNDLCISSGLAGALKPEHGPGEVLAAESVYAAGRKTIISCDHRLVEDAAICGAKIVKRFYSADHVVLGAKEKRELGLTADAVEMESGEVLYEAATFGAMGVAVRAISDRADEDLPLDFNRVTTASGDISMVGVLSQVAQNLGAVPSLIRFGRQSRLAAESLAEFLDGYLLRLATVDASVSSRSKGASPA